MTETFAAAVHDTTGGGIHQEVQETPATRQELHPSGYSQMGKCCS